MIIKVLGSGCAKCKRLEKLAKDVLAESDYDGKVEKVTDFEAIMEYDILSTPALVINEKVVCSGRIPGRDELIGWLSEQSN